tara:strand:+ start:401 stop:628 length:228 start_codon:yes stop_codon:yes gene_type:complete
MKMLIFEKQTDFFTAEIRTVDHPLAKFQATFITRKDVKPVTCIQCGWTTIAAAHKMIDWQAKKFEKNQKKSERVT